MRGQIADSLRVQIRDFVTRWFRWIATIAWALIVFGFFYRREDVGALGLAIMLAACLGLNSHSHPPAYMQLIKWTCIIGLLAYGVVLAFDMTGR